MSVAQAATLDTMQGFIGAYSKPQPTKTSFSTGTCMLAHMFTCWDNILTQYPPAEEFHYSLSSRCSIHRHTHGHNYLGSYVHLKKRKEEEKEKILRKVDFFSPYFRGEKDWMLIIFPTLNNPSTAVTEDVFFLSAPYSDRLNVFYGTIFSFLHKGLSI